MLKMSHGLGSVMLQFPSHLNVTDKKWHQLEVRTNGQVSYLIFSFRILAFTYADIQEDREKDWIILCIILIILVDFMSNRNFGKEALSISNLPML